MQRLLCTKEVALGDVGVHAVVVLNEEWLVEVLGLSIIPREKCEW